ncbi:MAG: polyprenyl diphosphate synthase [Thermoproteota archaeon]|nr:di-trans,poly-cis-decaprenylcistransferase [Candidatus Bathyarchaeota archaeon]
MNITRRLLKMLGIYRFYLWRLRREIKNGSIPSHVGIILDGNRRWAYKHGYSPWLGHRFGAEKVEEVLKWCLNLGVKTVTLYAFSTENFKRAPREVEELFKLFEEKLFKLLSSREIHDYHVRVKFIGSLELVPEQLRRLIEEIETKTANYGEHWLNIALAYGGRREIVDAVKRIAKLVKDDSLKPEEIDEELLQRFLYTAHLPNPEPDLIIRTSGEERLSGFLLWQSAYSELCFLEVYWPEFREIDLLRAIRVYQNRQRRFGR